MPDWVNPLREFGGYAVIVGIVLTLLGALVWRIVDLLDKRYSESLSREIRNTQEHRNDKALMIGVVQENSRTNTELSSAVNELTKTQSATNERLLAIDKHFVGKTSGNGD